MSRFHLLVLSFLLVACGCTSTLGLGMPPTALRDIDFSYDTVWFAASGAVQTHFPGLEISNKAKGRILSNFKMDYGIARSSPYEYAFKAELRIVPRESEGKRTYDIEVKVWKYYRPTGAYLDDNEGWSAIRRDKDLEDNIIKAFMQQTLLDQRIKQGHEKFKKRRRRGW